MSDGCASDRLGPNWLADDLARVGIDFIAQHMPDDVVLGRRARELHPTVTEREKHALLMRLEARFQAWAGESIVAFKIRTGGSHAR